MSNYKIINLEWKFERDPPPFEGNDLKSPECLYRHILQKYTKAGDKVFDPFVGLGTTMFVSEELKRIPYGIEADPQKFEWVAGQLENWMNVANDDSFNIDQYNLPKMDLMLTCPPFMERHTKWNPLYNGDPRHHGYDKYLKRMGGIFKKLAENLKQTGRLIIEVENINKNRKFTPLTHDIAQCLSKDYLQIGEEFVVWDKPKSYTPHTSLLIFKKRNKT